MEKTRQVFLHIRDKRATSCLCCNPCAIPIDPISTLHLASLFFPSGSYLRCALAVEHVRLFYRRVWVLSLSAGQVPIWGDMWEKMGSIYKALLVSLLFTEREQETSLCRANPQPLCWFGGAVSFLLHTHSGKNPQVSFQVLTYSMGYLYLLLWDETCELE